MHFDELPHPSRSELDSWEANLSSQAAALRRTIGEQQELLAQVDERLALVRRLLELEDSHGSGRNADTVISMSANGSTLNGHEAIGSFEDAVVATLESSGKPLHISALRNALVDSHIPIPGRGNEANIIVRISNDQRFTRTARGTYALSAWGLPTLPAPSRRRGARRRAKR